jgi:hypothetical protein
MNKTTLYFYGALLAGTLTVTMFAYTVILVPVWNWVSTIPGSVAHATSGWFSSKPATNSQRTHQQPAAAQVPEMASGEWKTPKPANCDKIIKQIKAGKYVELPEECRTAYDISRQQDEERERARQEAARQKETDQQREYERQRAEQEHRQQLEAAQQREAAEQREREQRQREVEQMRAANLERDQERQEAEDRRRREEREDADRRQAQRAAEQREQHRQREAQKRNDAIIKLGKSIGDKIFKKN